MFKFKDTTLPLNGRLRDSLTAIYGVGFQRASYICDSLGFGLSFSINRLNRHYFEYIVVWLKYFYIVDDRLKTIISQRLTFFFENRRIVGLRLFKGLPVRGQRTHTNRQTARNLKPFVAKKFEVVTPAKKFEKKQKNLKKVEKQKGKKK